MHKKRKSFTLIELMVSAVILGIGIALLGIMVINFNKLQSRASYYYIAFNLVRDPLEYIENAPWTHDSGPPYVMSFSNGQYVGHAPHSYIVPKLNEDYTQHSDDGQYALLPRNAPDSLWMHWEVLVERENECVGVPEGEIYAPECGVTLSVYDDNGEFLGEMGGFSLASSFMTWIGADGERKGMVLGVVPFTWYNQIHLNLENFYWETN